MRGNGARIALAAATLALAACDTMPDGPGRTLPARPVSPTPAPPSPESQEARAYYARVEGTLLSQGLLRGDGGGRDTPFGPRELADNFMAIALYDELVPGDSVFVPRRSASELRRWGGPIRMNVMFGDSVPEARRAADRGEVERFAGRLSRLTGVPIRQTGAEASNFDVLFLSEDERRGAAPLVQSLVPAISLTAVRTILHMPKDTYCMVFAFSEGASPIYTRALAVIRAEHPDTLRTACIHEELAQAMGLPNDSRDARPSIFNDDEEFGLLTRHDELLLRMLYDPRLRPGMTPEEARPVVERIAAELVAGES